MFDPASRYYEIENAVITGPDGREIPFKRRRFLPQGEAMLTLVEVTVVEGDRLDQIAARTLGDPEHFWRVADANNTLDPMALAEPGARLRVPVPQAEALIPR
jgi:nucleoid-associated protein YgaU